MNAHTRTFEDKPVPGYTCYRVNERGEVWRDGAAAPLTPSVSQRGGYHQVSLWEFGKGKTHFVHQIVALAFHGPRPSPRHHAAHRDGNKLNNTPTNVQWITKEENEADKILHGRTNRGERNGAAKLTDAQAADIRRRAQSLPRSSNGCRIRKGELAPLAAEYAVTEGCLRNIIFGRRRSAK